MDILYCIDEVKKDYSRYLWVSILSLLEKNKNENLHIYILSKYIEESNKQELIRIVKSYWKEIFFSEWEIIPEEFKKILQVNPLRPFTVFYRLFFLNCFDIKWRLLYLDCDTIVNKNLSKIYNSDFEWNTFIWSLEYPVVNYWRKKKYSLGNYINAWVLLIDAEKYKKIDLYKEIQNVNSVYWIPDANDQDYINLIFKNEIKIDNTLQVLLVNRWITNLENYYVFHTIKNPNVWWYWFCPPKIEELFDEYLKKTKWKSYIWWKRKMTIKWYISYIYDSFLFFIVHFWHKFFGVKFAFYTNKFLRSIWIMLWKIFKKT